MEVKAPADGPFGPVLLGDRAMLVDTDAAAGHFTVAPTQLLHHGRAFQEDGVQLEAGLAPPLVLLNLPTQQADHIQGISRSRTTTHLGLDIGQGFIVDSMRVRTRIA